MKRESSAQMNDYTLLITHKRDNDCAARKLVDGGEVVFFKLNYVPLYEKFEELKKLQIRTKTADLFGQGKTCIVIDISDWVGHENEQFFIVTMKYFHDHCYKWAYVFTVEDYSLSKVESMIDVINCYLKGTVHEQENPVEKLNESESEYEL